MMFLEAEIMNNFPRSCNILIPARGQSKRIKHKNIVSLCGKPLISYVIKECLTLTSNVYVSTDSDDIKAISEAQGATVVDRPDALSGDFARVEDTVEHFLTQVHSEFLVLVQPTSPLLKAKYILEGLAKIRDYDSIVAATTFSGFFWTTGAQPVNFIPGSRKRSQENNDWVRENGSFYVIKPEIFLKRKVVQEGRVGFVMMNKIESIEVDNWEDLNLLESFLRASS